MKSVSHRTKRLALSIFTLLATVTACLVLSGRYETRKTRAHHHDLHVGNVTSSITRSPEDVKKEARRRAVPSLPSSPSPSSSVRVVTPGENIQVDDLEVHITTAVSYDKLPGFEKRPYNLFLNGWARHKSNRQFKCCLFRKLPTTEAENHTFVEVQSVEHHFYDQWIVDMQNAEFRCALGDTEFKYVTFAKTSCNNTPPVVMEILQPSPVSNSLGLCLKISYGTINPEDVIEWFEYARIMGVTKVFTYYFDLDPPAFKVLDYYNSIGYLELLLIHPAKSKDGPERGFRRPRYEEQAWTDEVMAANDCKHRMAGFDYVIVMDMDEFIVPKVGTSILGVLQAAEKEHPKAKCFRFDSHVVMKDWGYTRASAPLHITKYTNRTIKPNYDGWTQASRWGFKPRSTHWMKNNDCIPQLDKYKSSLLKTIIPQKLCTLLHYRSCKPKWKDCKNRNNGQSDTSMVTYEARLVDRILDSLPYRDILSENMKYVDRMMEWRRKQQGN